MLSKIKKACNNNRVCCSCWCFDLLFVGINVAVVDVDVFVADLLYIGASVVVANVVEVPFVLLVFNAVVVVVGMTD